MGVDLAGGTRTWTMPNMSGRIAALFVVPLLWLCSLRLSFWECSFS